MAWTVSTRRFRKSMQAPEYRRDGNWFGTTPGISKLRICGCGFSGFWSSFCRSCWNSGTITRGGGALTMSLFTETEATIEDLLNVPDNAKAEIVNGKIVLMPPTGIEPGFAGDEIYVSLREYARRTGTGRAVGDNKGFKVDLPHRKSFSPDAAYVLGRPTGMRFYQGAPVFAVEVRSENDYGEAAEREMANKRADYFSA